MVLFDGSKEQSELDDYQPKGSYVSTHTEITVTSFRDTSLQAISRVNQMLAAHSSLNGPHCTQVVKVIIP